MFLKIRSMSFCTRSQATSNTRKMDFPSKRFLWRAQLGDHCEEVEIDGELSSEQGPLPLARMKPLAHSPHEGRVNPKGIPCLYLTTEKDTAMAEVRPWIGSLSSNSKCNTTGPDGLRCCHDTTMLHALE
jgi:hypothetical protein